MRHPHISSPPRSAGMTLVEILTVVSIIGLLALIALPNVNLSRIRAKSSIQSAGTALLASQREAVARQHNIVVMLDVPGSALRILYDSTNDATQNSNERVRPVPLGEEVVFGLPSGVTARSFGSTISFTTTVNGMPAAVFYRNGSAKESGGLYLTTAKAMGGIRGHGAETWAMELVRATGRAEWYRWNGTTWLRGF